MKSPLVRELASIVALATVQLILSLGVKAEVVKCARSIQSVPLSQEFISHPIGGLIMPKYPQSMRSSGIELTLALTLLVDQNGKVTRSCIVPARSLDKRTTQLFAEAAASAVKAWVYPKSFGLSGRPAVKYREVRGVVIFKFVTPDRVTSDSGVTIH